MKTYAILTGALAYNFLVQGTRVVFAQSGGIDTTGGSPCPTGQLCNPLSGTSSIPELLLKIIDVLLVFALPLIILYIMYAGFLLVTAKGSEGQIGTAKSAFFNAVVGGVIVLGARLIISVIQGTVTAF